MVKRRIGVCFMVLGLVLMAFAAAFVYENRREEMHAAEASQTVLEEMQSLLLDENGQLNAAAIKLLANDAQQDTLQEENTSDMPTMTLDGEEYIGYLELPTLGLSLPVMSSWSYPKLRTSPCRYQGTAQDGTLVILAHNYARHFGRLREMGVGDLVQLVGVDGSLYVYQVAALETLSSTDVDAMLESGYDLTLFTCTPGGRMRVAVRLTRVPGYE